MEAMYQEYKDIVEFRLIYIREAHALDSRTPRGVAREKNIREHRSYEERCVTAQMLMEDQELTMPMLIDGMDNGTNVDYSAYPDRVFLVRTDGRLAVASRRGPSGFPPGLDDAEDWLANFRATGEEPELTEEQIAKADAFTEDRKRRRNAYDVKDFEIISGTWNIRNIHKKNVTTHRITISSDGQTPVGKLKVGSDDVLIENLRIHDEQFSFSLVIGDSTIDFVGAFDGKNIRGEFHSGNDKYMSTWTRIKNVKAAPRVRRVR